MSIAITIIIAVAALIAWLALLGTITTYISARLLTRTQEQIYEAVAKEIGQAFGSDQ